MEIRTAEEIVRNGHSIRPNISREEYFKTRWLNVDSFVYKSITEVEKEIDLKEIKELLLDIDEKLYLILTHKKKGQV